MARKKDKHSFDFDPQASYVLKHRDRLSWVSLKTPVTESMDFSKALVFEGKWLAETVWSFEIFFTPVEYSEAVELWGTKPKKGKTQWTRQHSHR